MNLIDYEEQVYGELSVPKQLLLALINLSGRLWHGKQEWNEMNESWKTRQRATDVQRLGRVRIYENHRK